MGGKPCPWPTVFLKEHSTFPDSNTDMKLVCCDDRHEVCIDHMVVCPECGTLNYGRFVR